MPEEETSSSTETPTNESETTETAETPTDWSVEALPEGAQKLIKDLRSEAASYRKKAKELEPFKAAADEAAQAELTELERVRNELETIKQQAAAQELEALRLRVAAEKGLTPAQARRLAGTTEEELSADADDLVSTFKTSSEQPPLGGRPAESLRGGSDPTEPAAEMDPAKLAARIGRRHVI
jgi:hypothetical protein